MLSLNEMIKEHCFGPSKTEAEIIEWVVSDGGCAPGDRILLALDEKGRFWGNDGIDPETGAAWARIPTGSYWKIVPTEA